ncbi:hypothetical protein M405DRAFT_830360 [Rhizopogon salebrosus TDB-379]|nr:hypothetical protein M405DRAFT_830360 [Rhizopogon salebrosus TDB-379]
MCSFASLSHANASFLSATNFASAFAFSSSVLNPALFCPSRPTLASAVSMGASVAVPNISSGYSNSPSSCSKSENWSRALGGVLGPLWKSVS